MKKIILVLSAIAMTFAACSKDDENDGQPVDETVYGSVSILFQSDATFASAGELLVKIDGVTAATLKGKDSIFTKNDIVIEDTVVVTTEPSYDSAYVNTELFNAEFTFNRDYFCLDAQGHVIGNFYSPDHHIMIDSIGEGNFQAMMDLVKNSLCDTIYLTRTGVIDNRKSTQVVEPYGM